MGSVHQTVERAGQVLGLFTATQTEWGVTQVAAALSLPKTTAHGALAALAGLGLLHRTPAGRYRLGFMLVPLHAALMAQTSWRAVALRELTLLADRLGENSYLVALAGSRAVCLATQVRRPGRVMQPGEVWPSHALAAGKVLLAELADRQILAAAAQMQPLTPNTIVSSDELLSDLRRVRERGYALNIEEFSAGRSALAVPFHAATGEVLGALSVEAETPRFEAQRLRWLSGCQAAARAITAQLLHEHEQASRLRPAL